MSAAALDPFERSWAVLLRTRKRAGAWIGTPVNLTIADGRAYFGTPADSWKVKRLRNFADVEVAPSTVRGKPTGPALRARARLLRGDEARAAERLLVRRHPIVHRLVVPLELRLKRTTSVLYELTGFRPLEDSRVRVSGASGRRRGSAGPSPSWSAPRSQAGRPRGAAR